MNTDTHLLLIAPTRSGKGVGPIICTLLTVGVPTRKQRGLVSCDRPQGWRELRRDRRVAAWVQ